MKKKLKLPKTKAPKIEICEWILIKDKLTLDMPCSNVAWLKLFEGTLADAIQLAKKEDYYAVAKLRATVVRSISYTQKLIN